MEKRTAETASEVQKKRKRRRAVEMEGTSPEGMETQKSPMNQAATQDFTENDLRLSQAGNRGAKNKTIPGDHERTQDFVVKDGESALEDGTQQIDPNAPARPKRGPAVEKTLAEGAPAKSASAKQKNVLGDYKLLKKLGAGGMGAVYLAHQVSLDRQVALKVLPKHLASNETLVERFVREARVMAKMDHPNILRCFDVGKVQGVHYLAIEFVDGGDLQGFLEKEGKLPIGDAVHILLAAARGLAHAHAQNLIHRDIKPENILITKKGVVKVADLGLAKAMDENLSLTKSGTGAGTPLYMPPEQARNVKHVDHRSDIYSLGCMFYRMLTGDVPFKGDTLVEVIAAKDENKFAPARQFNEEIPARLDLIIAKLIQAKPDHRYQSCDEIINEIEALGLETDRLSFLPDAEPVNRTMSSSSTNLPPISAGSTPDLDLPDRDVDDSWYIELELPDGRTVKRKVSKDKLIGLIKNGAVDAETKASRDFQAKFHSIASFGDFTQLFHAKSTTKKADKKSNQMRDFIGNIDEEERKYRGKKFWRSLFGRVGGFFGFLICLALALAVLTGIAFLFFQEQMFGLLKQLGIS